MNITELRQQEEFYQQEGLKYELLIRAASGIYKPIILDDITLTQERKGAPATLEFTVVKDDNISFAHGNQVQLKVNGIGVFMGFVFIKTRDKKQHIKCTAYDQLRYLKNKDTYLYTKKKASEVIKDLADKFHLTTGYIEDTGFVIDRRLEENKTLFDMIQTALDMTLISTGQLYCLYDDFGQIKLRNTTKMVSNIMIQADTVQNFDYTSTIDSDTYNTIKLVRENKETKKTEVFMARDNKMIGEWGVLQYFETLQDNADGKSRADMLLKLYDHVQRTLTIKGCFGDIFVRAGSFIPVKLHLGDKIVDNKYLMCERVVHHFKSSIHTMELTVKGNKYLY